MNASHKATAEYLTGLTVGKTVKIRHKNKEVDAKLRAKYVDGAKSIQCVIPGTNGAIVWCELHNIILPGAEVTQPAPVVRTRKAVAKVAEELAVATPEPFVAAVEVAVDAVASEPAPERPKLAEFSQRILATLAEHGAPMLANDVAAKMEESMKRVAGCFGSLVKAGLIESHGGENKKGGKLIELTAAGYEYVNPEQYVDAGEPTVEEAGEELPAAPFECTKAHVLAMESLLPDGRDVDDIFTANLITDLEGHHPHPIAKFPTRSNPDAYFFAGLTVEGEDYAQFMRDFHGMGPRPEPAVVAGKLTAARNGEIMAEGTRIQRSASQVARHAEKKPTTGEGHTRLSLPAKVLAEFSKLATAGHDYKAAISATAVALGLRSVQVINAAFKLGKAGFLATDDAGKILTTLTLTERGLAGYSTGYGANLRPLIEAAIAEGLTNAAVASRVGCAISYVHDVRTKRATGYAYRKAKKERAAA